MKIFEKQEHSKGGQKERCLQLARSAVEADQNKNYTLASTLYEQAILNLKLAIISEKDPAKTALISSKVEEYTQRNKFIKSMAPQMPAAQPTAAPQSNNLAFNFPSIPSSVSPAVANTPANTIHSFPQLPQTQPQPTFSQQPSFPQLQQPSFQQQQQQQSQANISRLSSLHSGDQFTQKSNMGRVESYEIATNLAMKGRKEEESRDYKKASEYYQQACSYFLIAIKSEPDSIIKKSISDEAKIYLDRVETLKPYIQQQAQQQQQPIFTNTTTTVSSTSILGNFPTVGGGGGMNNSNSALSQFPSVGSMNNMNIINNNNNNGLNGSGGFPRVGSSGSIGSNGSGGYGSPIGNGTGMLMSPTSTVPSTFTGGDRCAACGATLSTNSIKALERSWHPECFSVTIICAGCQKPFSLVNLSLKVKDNRAYHPHCFESTTGLYQEERRTFVGKSKALFFSIQLQRKFYRAGETVQFAFIIDNPTSKKVDKVVAYMLMTETRMEIVGTAYERRSRKTVAKLGRCEFFQSTKFPLSKDRFEGDFFFSIPPNVLPSEVAGVDASFVREYQLVVKCVGSVLKVMKVKLRFNLNILESKK
ncbi:LIM-type zinc finger-containing protein [Heterostelium album PN500]|uniref:LIM-type zinc finger-containing protein n=1 Tax=Heterostelium pallidum (strain ATCC 26659 / Pp 5 / PN500) TaxID=670386 RepID=D3BJZ8_HETP5|nr:LIM-type zinc finger-containing protein [Heterostelium album PN500]EFA78228.1 LIM-type zinc finger-containing protein [Heterostelium album PN500]|eukprot:XP_020430353.1 LIM-type zinc finger-containing protein [Heterostelium album PN500]